MNIIGPLNSMTSSRNNAGGLITEDSATTGEAMKIMEEAHAQISGQASAMIPDVPAELKKEIVKERGEMI